MLKYTVPPKQRSGESYSISEVVEELSRQGFKVTTQQIRKYEFQKLINPVKKDPSSNYRLFEQKDIERLKWILSLRLLGFSISNIDKFIKLLDTFDVENLSPKMEMFKMMEGKDYSKSLNIILDFIDEFLSRSNKIHSTLSGFISELRELQDKYQKEKISIDQQKR